MFFRLIESIDASSGYAFISPQVPNKLLAYSGPPTYFTSFEMMTLYYFNCTYPIHRERMARGAQLLLRIRIFIFFCHPGLLLTQNRTHRDTINNDQKKCQCCVPTLNFEAILDVPKTIVPVRQGSLTSSVCWYR